MLIAWVLFPLVMLTVCLGCGLAVERLAGWRLPGALLLSVGLALAIVTATLLTYKGATAKYATAAVVLLALCGYAASAQGGRLARTGGGWAGRLRQLRPDPWALAVGLALYAVFAAPVVLSGNATFLGYFLLNDSAMHFTLIDQLLAHGRDLGGIRPSSTLAILQSYIATRYPIGAQVALGALRPLVGQDVAWIFQPYLAAILTLGGVALYQLIDLVRVRPLRALCAFAAAQAGLVYAYYLEASVKELATAWALTLTVALVVATLRGPLSLRRMVPVTLVAVAGFDVLDLAIAPWLALPLATFALAAAWRAPAVMRALPRHRLMLESAGFAIGLIVIAIPILAGARTFFHVANLVLTRQGDLGNLVSPLIKWQVLGIWPSGDFRFPVVAHYRIVYSLLGIAAGSAVLGVLWAVRRRAAGPLLLIAGSGLAALYLLNRASPYASGKVMMIFSLSVALAVMLGAGALHDSGRRLEAWGLAIVLTGGMLWTNALAYRGSSIAPRERLSELAAIGQRFAGQGPSFYNLAEEFAIHFLGREAPTDPIFGAPVPRAGMPPRTYMNGRAAWDPDELDESYLQGFRLLILGRSPRNSRPPADYRLVYRGRYYEVWRRQSAPRVLAHLALGAGIDPAAVPSCRRVLSLASRARREGARLAYVAKEPMAALIPTAAQRPPNWGEVEGDPYSLIPRQEVGQVIGVVAIKHAGRYQAWLQGSFSRRVEVGIDGRLVGSYAHELGSPGQAVPVGWLQLSAGSHRLAIGVPADSELAPGVMLVNQTVGPLMLASASEEAQPVGELAAAHARSLCGKRLDWIEIVR